MEFVYQIVLENSENPLRNELNKWGKKGFRVIQFFDRGTGHQDYRFFVLMEKKREERHVDK